MLPRGRRTLPLCAQVERRGTYRGGFYDPSRSKIQAMKEIKASGPGHIGRPRHIEGTRGRLLRWPKPAALL